METGLLSNEQIVLVDDNDQKIGVATKLESHHGSTPLHRAISLFLFNAEGKLLVTQRAKGKKTFPGVWSNTLCGHTAPGEAREATVIRRANQELGFDAQSITDLTCAIPHFQYTAEMNGITENEICPVYVARTDAEPQPYPGEIEDYTWMSWDEWLSFIKRTDILISSWCIEETEELLKWPGLKDFIGKS